MPNCPLCNNEFLRLDENTACGKCKARKPGMSTADYAVINNKPQCSVCGLISNNLKNPLCNGCIEFYKNKKELPFSILQILDEGTRKLFLTGPSYMEDQDDTQVASRSALTTTILESAYIHQQKASTNRLGVPKTTSTSLLGLNQFKNLSKAKAIQDERKAKKVEVQLRDVGIRVVATIWKSDKNKLTQIGQIRVSGVYEPTYGIKNALDNILEKIRSSFEKVFPDAVQLNWTYVTVHAHESATKFTSLEDLDWRGTMNDLYNDFTKGRLGNSNMLTSRTIEIRLVYQKNDIHRTEDEHALESSLISVSGSKRKRVESQSAMINLKSKLRNATAAAMDLPSASLSRSSAVLSSVVLKSAFRPPTKQPKWMRNPEMIQYSFTYSTAKFISDGNVVFTSMEPEKIEIAKDWKMGETLYDEGEAHEATGFIGKGYSKRGIYARFRGKEYSLTQPMDPNMSSSEVEDVLRAEYRLLCQCDGFKTHFDAHAKASKVHTIPRFYFNFKESILGKIQNSPSSGSRIIPHQYFLATLLLPCGKVDGGTRKFTGNDEIGSAPVDDLTKAVHAFAHFSLLYSQEHILFCDLQGALDLRGIMCLFDPQAHTNASDGDREVYWDGGPKKIKAFIEQHAAMCGSNWVCTILGLENATVEQTNRENTPSPKKTVDKHSVDFLIDSE